MESRICYLIYIMIINLEAGILIAFIGIMLLIKGKRDREDM